MAANLPSVNCSKSPDPSVYEEPLSNDDYLLIALDYEAAKDQPDHKEKALAWYLCSASAGDESAMSLAAIAIWSGEGIEADPELAVPLWEELSENNDPMALGYLADFYGRKGNTREAVLKALEYAKRGATVGDALATEWLIYFLEVGRGIQQDFNAANDWRIRLYERYSADELYQDDAAATAQTIAYVYAVGKPGLPADPQNALKWFRIAAEYGKDVSMGELSRRLHWGHGVASDPEAAATMLSRITEENAENFPLYSFDQASLASLDVVPCWFENHEDYEVVCGWATLPQDYDDPGAGSIRIPFTVWLNNVSFAGYPPVMIPGGGGPGSAVGLDEQYGGYLRGSERTILNTGADLITLDQRGAGESTPNLTCKELYESELEEWKKKPKRRDEALWDEQLLRCLEKHRHEGSSVERFTTAASARDFEEVRKALGYTRWSVFGTSYGARIALYMAQTYPESVATLILDSPDSPLGDETYIASEDLYSAAVKRILNACESDPECAQSYPSLADNWLALSRKLEKRPVAVFIDHPSTLTPVRIYLDHKDLAWLLFNASYTYPERVPKAIAALFNGSTRSLERLIEYADLFDVSRAIGLAVSISCRENLPVAVSALRISGRDSSAVREAIQSYENVCPAVSPLGEDAVIDWRLPELSQPVLILAGQFDPITTIESSERLASILPNPFVYIAKNCGHGVANCNYCAQETIARFIAHPSIDPRTHICDTQRVHWHIPVTDAN